MSRSVIEFFQQKIRMASFFYSVICMPVIIQTVLIYWNKSSPDSQLGR